MSDANQSRDELLSRIAALQGRVEELTRSERLFRGMVEQANDIIYNLSPDGVLIYVSPNWVELLGHPVAETIGQPIEAFVHPDDLPACREYLQRVAQTGGRQGCIDYRIRHQNGTWRWHTSNAASSQSPEDEGRFVGIARDITDRKDFEQRQERTTAELELALREQSRARQILEILLDASPAAVFLVDAAGRIRVANRHVENFFALPKAEALKLHVEDLVLRLRDCFVLPDRFTALAACLRDHPDPPPESPQGMTQLLERTLKIIGPQAREVALFSWSVGDDSGVDVGRLWLFSDVTHFRRSEEQIHKIVEASPVPLIITRLTDGKILFANQPLADLVRGTVAGLVGQVSPDFYYIPEERVGVVEAVRRDGHLKNREIRFKRLDGSAFWVSLSLVLVEIGGEPSVVGGLLDIDERKQIERALRLSEARFRALVENANDIIFSADADGTLNYVSPRFTEVTGHPVSRLLGMPVQSLLCPTGTSDREGDLSQATSVFSRRGSAEASAESSAYRLKHKNGTWRWFVADASEVRGPDGNVAQLVGIAHDVTEIRNVLESLKRANEELKQTQAHLVHSEKMAALGMLVAGIAHEINTPVGAIGSMHDTLERAVHKLRVELGSEIEQRPQLHRLFSAIENACSVIDSGSKRVTDIVRRLRSFARLDEAELKEASLHEGLDDTLVLAHHELKNRIRVVKNYGVIPRVSCFPSQLNQVFLNLVINASQAIEGEGEIAITTAMVDGQIRVTIHDTGVGIPEDHLQRIFDPGFTTKGVGVGTGLGLAICYQIIEAHHGQITAASGPGAGTTFTITLPTNLDHLLDAGSNTRAPR